MTSRLAEIYKQEARRPLTLSESREKRELEQQASPVVTPSPLRMPSRRPTQAESGSVLRWQSPDVTSAAAARAQAAGVARARGEALETHGIGVILEHRESR